MMCTPANHHDVLGPSIPVNHMLGDQPVQFRLQGCVWKVSSYEQVDGGRRQWLRALGSHQDVYVG
jgi:hypothetical protein